MQNQTKSELYTDDKKPKHFSNSNGIQSQLKTLMKSFIQKRQRSKLPLLNFLVKFLPERKSQISPLRGNNFLEKVTKSITS